MSRNEPKNIVLHWENENIEYKKIYGAPVGIRTRVFGSKGRNDWPDYTIGANTLKTIYYYQ